MEFMQLWRGLVSTKPDADMAHSALAVRARRAGTQDLKDAVEHATFIYTRSIA